MIRLVWLAYGFRLAMEWLRCSTGNEQLIWHIREGIGLHEDMSKRAMSKTRHYRALKRDMRYSATTLKTIKKMTRFSVQSRYASCLGGCVFLTPDDVA